MPASYLPVSKGPAQQLTGATLDQGSFILNNDPANAVWIGSDGTVSPGHGTLLNPQASVAWSGKQVWACLDTGVTATVTLLATTDITQLNDPVSVGVAVALKLLQTGIPALANQTYIGQITVPANSISAPISCAGFASIIVGNNGAARVAGWQMAYNLFDPSGLQVGGGNFGVPADPLFVGFGLPEFVFPVRGTSFTIQNLTAAAVTVSLTGSSRMETVPRDTDDNNTVTSRVVTQAFAVGVPVVIVPFLDNTGPIQFEFLVTGTVIVGSFTATDIFGNVIDIADTAEMHTNPAGNRVVYKQLIMAATPVNIQFTATGGATGTVLVRFMGNTQ